MLQSGSKRREREKKSLLSTVLCWSLGRFFSFLILIQSVGLLGRGISPSQGRYLRRTTQIQNKLTQTSMPWVGFEPSIPAVERAKTVCDLDRAATVDGILMSLGQSCSHSLQSQVAILSNFSIVRTKPYQPLIENLNTKHIMRNVLVCTFQRMLLIWFNHGRWSDVVAQRDKNKCKIVIVNAEREIQSRICRYRWKDNITPNKDLKERQRIRIFFFTIRPDVGLMW
jgi:hypothetical protein